MPEKPAVSTRTDGDAIRMKIGRSRVLDGIAKLRGLIRPKKIIYVSGYIGQKVRVGRSEKKIFQIFLLHRYWSKY
jgi:hypothetical protein